MKNSFCVYLSFGRCGNHRKLILKLYDTHSAITQAVRIILRNIEIFSILRLMLKCQNIDEIPHSPLLNKIVLSRRKDVETIGGLYEKLYRSYLY
jgi:hypothetical protein